MFTVDIPSAPLPETAMVLAQAVTPTASPTTLVASSNHKPDYILKDCQEFPNPIAEGSAEHGIAPALALANYYETYFKRNVDVDAIHTSILVEPKHGAIYSLEKMNTYGDLYSYDPKAGFFGEDKVVFQAEFGGKTYKIVMKLMVIRGEGGACTEPRLIKVSGSTQQGFISSGINTDSQATILANASLSFTGFADLAGAAVGQTTGTNITLDTTAAGNGWFVDSTPSDNSEYLPTSNPNEWIAKAGSAAAGKMDMLSVLLHEYGHALGIDHSANPNDFMATTLTAGVRRLPSAAEMALMQQLIAQAKTGVLAAQTGNAATDQPNNTPLPIIPLGGFGIAFAGLLQRNRYGGVNLAIDANTVVTQYAVAANATLTNGSLTAADGWSTQGSVDIAFGAATLNEVATRQTRLSQVFMVNPNDHYLTLNS